MSPIGITITAAIAGTSRYPESMAEHGRVITAADMDKMTPQQRADAIDAAVRRNWDQVDPDFREQALTEARRLNAQLRDG